MVSVVSIKSGCSICCGFNTGELKWNKNIIKQLINTSISPRLDEIIRNVKECKSTLLNKKAYVFLSEQLVFYMKTDKKGQFLTNLGDLHEKNVTLKKLFLGLKWSCIDIRAIKSFQYILKVFKISTSFIFYIPFSVSYIDKF